MNVILKFEDSEKFYSALKENLKSGHDIEIQTDFTKQTEIPDRFKSALGGKKFDAEVMKLAASAGAIFTSGASTSFEINWVILCGSVGAVVGAFAGGPPGAAVGATIGACIGFVASLTREDADKEVTLEVGLDGTLKVKIKTTKK